jgi:hypothetical protein
MIMNEFPRYTTKTGLKIGGHYTPPYINRFTPEDEHMQRVLLGVKEDSCVLIQKLAYYGAIFFVAVLVAFLMTRPGDV